MKAIDPLLKAAEDPLHLARLADVHVVDVLSKPQVCAGDRSRHPSQTYERTSTSNSTSGEEGYDSINSDEELHEPLHEPPHEPLDQLSVISSGRLFAGGDGGVHQPLSLSMSLGRTLSLNDSEDSGASSSSSTGPPTFQELKVTSDLSSTASPKRATFTIGSPLGTPSSTPVGTPLSTPAGTPKQLSSDSQRRGPGQRGEAPAVPPALPGRPAETSPSPRRSLRLQAEVSAAEAAGDELSAGWNRTVAEAKEQAFSRLQEELRSAHQELRLRDEEVTRLSRIREQVEAELEELTASLFQEAHNMVRDANTRQAAAERSLAESRMQVEVLTAEVAALKTLVLTSTPARPNPHLHPQIDKTKSCDDSGGGGLFRKHRRSPSHFNLKYGRENSPPESPVKENHSQSAPTGGCVQPVAQDQVEPKDGIEVDPNVHRDFLVWRQCPTIDKTNAFVARVYREDIDLCLNFNNRELAERVGWAVECGNIYIEAVGDRSKTAFPKKCALLEVPRQCHYRMRLGDQDTWHSISQICRNRITAVIDFLNYLRYIERGLVKSSVHDVYWEIVRLRKEMCLARLGLSLSS
ncbi:hypothetical protein ONE63_006549 [Megalurothrips usitatus]|uniref:GDP/GTP exchange factor Sec2 N-terminal domain-containing protein n=1 Tax=Megalurothrips usitatus TaxID=439358 RepID=A0AAV7XTQ5_9NEOP|nr:hypothetical protein ONE63_006549 [Megalurothrips usitatus]